ncbi:MAG: 50S ribosomal protein L10 [Candidatus Micrarchaeaceae archaeon]
MQKRQKEAFVKGLKESIAKSKTVAVMPINGMPDALLQKVRNQLRGSATIVVSRKTLLLRALEGKPAQLASSISGNVAIVLSDLSPFELYKKASANKIELSAKPGQIAPSDIVVKAGETSVAPGQAVTELKSAGIDVQIQRNKVVIAKDKVVVEAGKRVNLSVANALKVLGIRPFAASATLSLAYSEGVLFSSNALSIDEAFAAKEIAKSFAEANCLSIGIGFVTQYNAGFFIAKAYAEAMALGIAAEVLEPEIVSTLLSNAAAGANKINNLLQHNNGGSEGQAAQPSSNDVKA